MSKAFTRESESDDLDEEGNGNGLPSLPSGSKNYITPEGHKRLMDEFLWLMNRERPQVTATVSWAAANGDRSENADYIYGKKRLREIDRRIRFLTRRLDMAEIIDPSMPREDESRIFFGATVTYINEKGEEKIVSIVGVNEIDTTRGYISWVSPLARTLLKAREGDVVTLHAPGGTEELEILEVRYQAIPMEPFRMGSGMEKTMANPGENPNPQ
ncbi:transcription elongation factor GreB [Nitrosospira multiformis ATCC 25196]|uniref:Transcription elongation factor GreB n=1 Tax=Nitrosospira multiformis (strain ATCC 25196 / NCIMB 11849 / C 71) TaxID=323848 RepID=Q2Y7V5_NITMU|nr:transcription elongation factor GreB [Nitrosospira multiformis]ABB75166.1 GreA/GreB family elongation factor [Nitrosospira multiformis ATCC 25196]SEF61475.1 transcription elongation factor GreB [Nitrosospira multiformis ATCC 25196]